MIKFMDYLNSVNIMSKKLDPEGLGIILLNAFMDEFFPEEKRSTPDTFNLVHYNGIPRSNFDDKVSVAHVSLFIFDFFIQNKPFFSEFQ